MTMESEDLSNRARFEALKKGLKDLFHKVGQDLKAARLEQDPEINRIVERVDKKYRLEQHYIGAEGFEQEREVLVERLIAKWSGAQILLQIPEIVDETTPEIEEDVSTMLVKAEVCLEELADGYWDEAALRAQEEYLIETFEFNDEQCRLYNGLQSAENLLEDCHMALFPNS